MMNYAENVEKETFFILKNKFLYKYNIAFYEYK
jgi:hypothetical protein